ncbi:hypothetical protein Tco_0466031 [Tanacetum coccineum]
MHSIAFCLRKASPDKRTGRKSKPEFGGGNKSKAGKRQQELDGRNLSFVIPAEIRMPTFRTTELDMAKNDEALQINLELLEEKRCQAP